MSFVKANVIRKGPPQGRFYLVLNEIGREKRLYVPLNKRCVSVGVSSRSDVVLPFRSLFGIDPANATGLYVDRWGESESPWDVYKYQKAEFRLTYKEDRGTYVWNPHQVAVGFDVRDYGGGDFAVEWPEKGENALDHERHFSITVSLSVVDVTVPAPLPRVDPWKMEALPAEILGNVVLYCQKHESLQEHEFPSRVLAAVHPGFRDLASSVRCQTVHFNCRSYECVRIAKTARKCEVKRLVQANRPVKAFKDACMQAWAHLLKHAKNLEELRTSLLLWPETKLGDLVKLRTLVLTNQWDSPDALAKDDDEDVAVVHFLMTSPDIEKIAGNLTTLSITEWDPFSMRSLNGAKFFGRFSALTALLMSQCPLPIFWSSAPRVALDKITRLDMMPSEFDYEWQAVDRYVIDVSRMRNLVYLNCFAVQFGLSPSRHLATVQVSLLVGSDGARMNYSDPRFWNHLGKRAPNLRNMLMKNGFVLDLELFSAYLSSSRVEVAVLNYVSSCTRTYCEDLPAVLRLLAKAARLGQDGHLKYLSLCVCPRRGDGWFPDEVTPEEVSEVLGPDWPSRAEVGVWPSTLEYVAKEFAYREEIFRFLPKADNAS